MKQSVMQLKIIHTATGLFFAAAVGVCWLYTKDLRLTVALFFLLLTAFLIMVSVSVLNNNQNRQLLSELSDLIASISSFKTDPVFPEFNDSITSKLQSQVVRLTDMLKAQNGLINKEKEEIKSLISDISHQLKTPVSVLKMYADLMLDESISDEERRRYLDTFSTALDKLVFLTDSLIKMSRLESGIISLNQEVTELRQTVLDAVMQAYEKAVKKDIRIVFDDDRGNILLFHDKRWTAEALFNIIDNAVKYSPDGSEIVIDVQEYELFVRIDVIDNGIGIQRSDYNKIFTRFYRGKNALDEEGSGIGLYLSRQIITGQNGYIKVNSTENGSVFSVFLPRLKPKNGLE